LLDVSVAEDAPPPAAFDDPERRAKLLAAAPKIDAVLERAVAEHRIPALAVGLVIDGELVLSRGYGKRAPEGGKVDADTVFRIGSITKTFTATVALMLRDKGKLDLDRPLASYLRQLGKLSYPAADDAPISMRMLLTHGSGLPRLGRFDYTDPSQSIETRELLATLAEFPLRRDPGTSSHYSNLGAGIAGLVIAEVAGMRYRDYVTRMLLEPLGMDATVWNAADVPRDRLASGYDDRGVPILARHHWRLGASEAAGGLYSNVSDLARYAAFQLAAWPPRSERDRGPVRRSSLRESHGTMSFATISARLEDPKDKRVSATGIGLAWIVEQSCRFEHLVWHDGGTEGYRSALLMLPQRGVAVIALSRGQYGMVGLAKEVLTVLDDTGALAPRRPRPTRAIAQALSHVDALLTDKKDIDDKSYATLFSAAFQRKFPRATFMESVRELDKDHGRCRYKHLIELNLPSSAVAAYDCERAPLEVRLGLDDDGLFAWLSMDKLEPAERCR
jgi:CubicO group peptidase (beta-lactamase class C family)